MECSRWSALGDSSCQCLSFTSETTFSPTLALTCMRTLSSLSLSIAINLPISTSSSSMPAALPAAGHEKGRKACRALRAISFLLAFFAFRCVRMSAQTDCTRDGSIAALRKESFPSSLAAERSIEKLEGYVWQTSTVADCTLSTVVAPQAPRSTISPHSSRQESASAGDDCRANSAIPASHAASSATTLSSIARFNARSSALGSASLAPTPRLFFEKLDKTPRALSHTARATPSS